MVHLHSTNNLVCAFRFSLVTNRQSQRILHSQRHPRPYTLPPLLTTLLPFYTTPGVKMGENMSASASASVCPIKFGTSGWRGLIADDFTFASVRLAITAIAEHVKGKSNHPTILVAYDTRFYSEEFSALAVAILQQHGIRAILCDTFTPTPAVAYEIQRSKLDGAINFTASHNPAQYHGLKFSSSDAGPALPEVTMDIEARAAKLFARGGVPPIKEQSAPAEKINLRENYLKRLEQLVRFDVLAQAKSKFAVDALHGCGTSYLNKILAD